MKKSILLLTLAVISTPCFATFYSQMPQTIVCDEQSFCNTQDSKYDLPGWSFMSAYGYLKPGVYNFDTAVFDGNPNDNFQKHSQFMYTMTDKDGYHYSVTYNTTNWLVPMHKENYHREGEINVCRSDKVTDCYVTILATQLPK